MVKPSDVPNRTVPPEPKREEKPKRLVRQIPFNRPLSDNEALRVIRASLMEENRRVRNQLIAQNLYEKGPR